MATSNTDGEEDVFEIREWLDEDGNEVSNEVYSVKEAAAQVQALDLVGALEKAAKAKKGATTAAATAAEVEEAVQRHQEGSSKDDGDTTTSDSTSNNHHGPSAMPSVAQRLLDDHDWDGIKERAKEIETLQRKSEHGELAAEADSKKGRNELEGSGWGKGFFLNNHERSNHDSSSNKKNTPSPSPPTTTNTSTAAKSPTKSGLRDASSPTKTRKHVTFDLGREQQPSSPRWESPLDMPPHQHSGRYQQQEADEEKDEEKRVAHAIRQLQQRGPAAFSGQISEVKEQEGKEEGDATAVEALEPAAVPEQNIAPPGMSRFKARALGLLSEDGSN